MTSPASQTDDYIVAAIRRLQTAGIKDNITIFISCMSFPWQNDGALTVTHSLEVGATSNKIKLEGCDLDKLVSAVILHHEVLQGNEPKTYQPALPAPTEPDAAEEAEFVDEPPPLQVPDLDDAVPF